MKLTFLKNGLLLSLLLLFVLTVGTAKARATPLLADQEHAGDEPVKMDGTSHVNHSGEMEGEETSWNNVMGLEDCNDGDEECLKRRLISEAHLDYIYTQQQQP